MGVTKGVGDFWIQSLSGRIRSGEEVVMSGEVGVVEAVRYKIVVELVKVWLRHQR